MRRLKTTRLSVCVIEKSFSVFECITTNIKTAHVHTYVNSARSAKAKYHQGSLQDNVVEGTIHICDDLEAT